MTPLPHGSALPSLARLLALSAMIVAGVLAPVVSPTSAARPAAGTTQQVGLTAPAAEAGSSRPNIVLVMADDMRADDLQFAPRISQLLGREGLTFANSFSPYPLCCPARASLLTGQLSHHHRVYWHGESYGYASFDDSRTVATSLRRAGYRTGFVGKYLNGYGSRRSKVTGERSYSYVPNGWTDWAGALDNPGRNLDPGDRRFSGGTYKFFNTAFNVDGVVDSSHRGQYQSGVIGDFATGMVRRWSRQRSPFFLYASFVAPHHGGPREPDDPVDISTVDGVLDGFATPARPEWVKGRFDESVTRASGMPSSGGPAEADVTDKPSFFRQQPELTAAERQALTLVTRQRAESIYVLDRQVARLVRELKLRGEWDDTVLMFTSDNGYFLGEHRQRTGKVRAHEPSLRVPFLVTGPGMRTGETRYDPITSVDITASILDMAGARAPRRADGVSRWPTMLEGDSGWDAPVLTSGLNTVSSAVPDLPTNPDGDPATPPLSPRRPARSLPDVPQSAYPTREDRQQAAATFGAKEVRTSIGLRTARYSFSLYRNGEGELYDLATDPTQEHNRYRDPEYAEVRAALSEQWGRYRNCSAAECQAPLPDPLRVTASRAAVLGESYWTGVDAVFGPQVPDPAPAG